MDHRWLADLFSHLAALDQAGLAPQQAFASLARDAPPKRKPRLEMASRLCGRGLSVGKSALRAAVVDGLDGRVLEASGLAGRLQDGYRRLAQRHAAADLRARRIKSTLLLPAFILTLAAFVKPLPALITGALDPLGYLRASAGLLIAVLGGGWLAVQLVGRFAGTAAGQSVAGSLLGVPVLGQLLIRRQRARYLEALAMLVQSGVPVVDALDEAAKILPGGALRDAFGRVQRQVHDGATLERAFAASPYLTQRVRLLTRVAESAGTLDDTLSRIAEAERDDLESLENALATWLPRLAYLLFAGWIASGILAGGALTTLPADFSIDHGAS